MAKLSGIGIENFRVFKDYTEFEFAPITLLTGANNSGKSSLIKALLLLADNAKNNGLLKLTFDGEYEKQIQLGGYEIVKNNASTSDYMYFQLIVENFQIKDNPFLQIPTLYVLLIFNAKNRDEGKLEALLASDKPIIYNDIDLQEMADATWEGGEKAFHFFDKNKNLIMCSYNFFDANNDFELVSISNTSWFIQYFHEKDFGGHSQIMDKNMQEVLKSIIKLKNSPKNIFDKEEWIRNSKENGELLSETSYNELAQFVEYKLSFPTLQYGMFIIPDTSKINPNREYRYLSLSSSENFGSLRQKTLLSLFDAYWEYYYQNRLIENEPKADTSYILSPLAASLSPYISDAYVFLFNVMIKPTVESVIDLLRNDSLFSFDYLGNGQVMPKRVMGNEENTLTELLQEFESRRMTKLDKKVLFLNDWFSNKNKFGFNYKVNIKTIRTPKRTEADSFYEINLLQNDKECNIADLGFGVAQILTILLYMILSNKKNLIIEEPETNIHPNLQSKLADLLVTAHREFGVTCIVETHSEYLIRKLRVLTKKGIINKNDTVIYYFQNIETLQEGEDLVKKIQINHNGAMTDSFGNGFTDESDSLTAELYELPNRKD